MKAYWKSLKNIQKFGIMLGQKRDKTGHTFIGTVYIVHRVYWGVNFVKQI